MAGSRFSRSPSPAALSIGTALAMGLSVLALPSAAVAQERPSGGWQRGGQQAGGQGGGQQGTWQPGNR